MGMLAKNTPGYKILTPDGYKDFAGVAYMGVKPIYRLEFEQNIWIECTADHEIYINDLEKIAAKKIKIGDMVETTDGNVKLLFAYDTKKVEKVYDVVDVDGKHRFYANDVLVSNCEFLIFDETLISPTMLIDMMGTSPIERQGQVRWYGRPKKDHMYLVALDPSLGTGGDNAAIQVFELPNMKQIAEWQHNKTPIQQQVQIMAKITEYLVDMIGDMNNVYYSVENNTLGEASLVTIAEIGEENIQGTFLSEARRSGNSRAFRRGFNTTNKTKLAACAKTKSLIETKRLEVNSSNLISEFKNFIAVRNTYEAKVGETDDLVMATLLAVRMAQTLQNFDPTLDAALRDKIDADIQPMPFIIC